jgi:hypothetical protein
MGRTYPIHQRLPKSLRIAILGASMRKVVAFAVFSLASSGIGCKDLNSFTTEPGEAYCGGIVDATFVRNGFPSPLQMSMTFDADHMSDRPGELSTSDGFLTNAPMRPIEQLFSDPLLMLQFGEGRDKNLIYMVNPNDPAQGPTVTVVLSLLHSGDAEVRLIRGANAIGGDASPQPADGPPLFGVFSPLRKEKGPCSF